MKCPKCDGVSVITRTVTERESITVDGELVNAIERKAVQQMCADCGHVWEAA